jgi:hypothetical protein
MSFRVKTTHKLLDQYVPPPPQKTQSTRSKKDDGKNNFLDDDEFVDTVPVNSVPESRPNISSSKGLAIRTVTLAQADHM